MTLAQLVRDRVEIRRSRRARRMSLRIEPATGGAVLVAPHWARAAEMERFLERYAGWLEVKLAALPARRPFVDGGTVPILGVALVIRSDPEARRPVVLQPGTIVIGGDPAHLARRLTDHLKALARCELTVRTRDKAALIGRPVAAVGVRDAKTRWGSCAATGRINYSWRLIMAPDPVLDYVAAHEVAHLIEANHGPRFWKLVARLTPAVDGPRAWLKANGSALHRYG